MILPSKHISLSESFFGLGGILLGFLKTPLTVDEIFNKYYKINNTKKFPAHHNFDNVILALDYLFIVGAIDLNEEGKIKLCN
ncbi:MAG: hypothetical protein PF638_04560 [Candidatus Delongbacteria bacterium]|jgi:multisubunit Na+/H+ antiporter MnhB subunit|nr:hypothetical protein [Candidatus Delongbacteria bacterium]